MKYYHSKPGFHELFVDVKQSNHNYRDNIFEVKTVENTR